MSSCRVYVVVVLYRRYADERRGGGGGDEIDDEDDIDGRHLRRDEKLKIEPSADGKGGSRRTGASGRADGADSAAP